MGHLRKQRYDILKIFKILNDDLAFPDFCALTDEPRAFKITASAVIA
jgi:hypothetical protein